MSRLILLLTCLCLSVSAYADDYSILIPELTGDYEIEPVTSPISRSTNLTLDPDIVSVEGFRLVLSGTWTDGLVSCSNPYGGPRDTTSFSPGLSVFIQAPGEVDGFFHATIDPPTGEFEFLSAPFTYCCPGGTGDPNLLLGKTLQVEFFCDAVLILPCGIIENAFGVIDEVRLDLLGPVSTEATTWGEVKSLYR
jgi:hypothetical protein